MIDKHTPQPDDIRPLVAMKASNRPVWLFGTGLALGAGLLFYALDSHRRSLTTPATVATTEDAGPMIAAPADLAIPEQATFGDEIAPPPASRSGWPVGERSAVAPRAAAPPVISTPSASVAQPGRNEAIFSDYVPPAPPTPAVIYSAPNDALAAPSAEGAQETPRKGEERVRASRFANPATTVPKGTVMQAVLESALDSTRAGYARAIISRDVFSFDGSRILVPKGSRLIGEYKADLEPGQKRALIQWQRLMRPDGIVINIDSPTADPLGRAGVKGDVNTHFLERFSGAILQSALDIGVQLATRRVSRNSVIVALPGSTQGIVGTQPEKIQPTLKVKQGTSVSVFVARDLDFTSVGS